ncbi:MAG: helix-turn-helix transcriptional regulator [Dehalococcoidia bacterium]|nr:helix-turn-helix transcriptional regulator [Dehalococcoidia bacterium]
MPVEEPRLTQREIEILERAAEGLTNRAIAGDLGIAESTVGHHLEHVYRKLGVGSRAAAVSWYERNVRSPEE